MFTGLVEEVGLVESVEWLGDAARLSFRAPTVTSGSALGDSISVNGCCLTVAELTEPNFTADVMAQSLSRTSLGALEVGSPVNLERAVAVGERLGGHIVQGHVDTVGTLVERSPAEHWEVLRFSLPTNYAGYVAAQGSISVQGVSLTVVEVSGLSDEEPTFTVSLIPTTLGQTTLGVLAVQDRVNLEVDVLAKYVARLLDKDQVS